ncbi:hypothetical protein RHMOL_Rhmol03G0180800 [Rhododendron molle]|uniref:Uncharacterized protein n=1 Tax=Rhododendron molle TaxID=49168 RepID=A0ACC0PGZ5_RHOML|nr:hypothetical protein RHMOL_Rhmol03G0180800 [Rhododendron molle]
MFRLSHRFVSRSIAAANWCRRQLSTDIPAEIEGDSPFVQAWKKIIRNLATLDSLGLHEAPPTAAILHPFQAHRQLCPPLLLRTLQQGTLSLSLSLMMN